LGKTVFVLGAGASHHTGAPLLRNFLVKARLLKDGNTDLVYRASFDKTFDWIDSLRGSSYYVEFDLDTLEHVFSLAELSKQIKLDQEPILHSDLSQVVVETLDRCQIEVSQTDFRPDPLYEQFVKKLMDSDTKRSRLVQISQGHDVIITFN